MSKDLHLKLDSVGGLLVRMFPSDICSSGQNGMGTTREDCEKKIDKALNRNITVKFMREKLKEVDF